MAGKIREGARRCGREAKRTVGIGSKGVRSGGGPLDGAVRQCGTSNKHAGQG